jgi:hypothetical protein
MMPRKRETRRMLVALKQTPTGVKILKISEDPFDLITIAQEHGITREQLVQIAAQAEKLGPGHTGVLWRCKLGLSRDHFFQISIEDVP